jgi:hypothetical protein
MKSYLILASGLLAAGAAHAQDSFVAGWDFDSVNGVEVVAANWGVQGTQFGSGTASFYWNGTGPSTNFVSVDPPNVFAFESGFGGFNAAVGNEFLVVNAAGSSGFDQFSDNFPNSVNHLRFFGNNGGINDDRAIIQFNAALYTGLSIQFAAFNEGSGLVNFTYSTDGVTFSPLQTGVSYGSAFELGSLSLSVLNGASTAYIGIGFANAANDTYGFDNIQIVGTAIPEPSSFAAIAGLFGLGFAATRRRFHRR